MMDLDFIGGIGWRDVVLAQQGMAANGIAGHGGISIGEAELVAALARSGSEFERHQQGEDRDDRNTDSGN